MEAKLSDLDGKLPALRFSMATSPGPSDFAPLVFAGRLEYAIRALADAGFSGVEISLRDAEELETEWLARQLSVYELKVSAFASGRMCLEDSLCLCNPDAAVREKAFEVLTSLVRMAARFGAPLIIGGVRGRLTGNEVQRTAQRAAAKDALGRLANLSAQLGTHLLLEPINRYETNFINTAQEGMSLTEEIRHPAIKLLLDTFHMNIEEADPCLAIQRVGNRLGYVHFADNNRLAPGMGHIDFPSLMRTLAQIGYSGFLSAEVLPLPDDEAALSQTSRYLHSLVTADATGHTYEKGK